MNVMKQIKFFLIILISILTLVACSKPDSVEHWIDNPTDKEITLNIDDNPLTIPAKSGIKYKIGYGKHTLSYNNESINFVVKPSKREGFINPTQSNYVFYKLIYIDKSNKIATDSFIDGLEKDIQYKTQVIVNGELQVIEVPFKVVNDLFIEKDTYAWDYFLDEDLPTTITLRDNVKDIKAKLFRESDFLKYIKKDGIDQQISFPSNRKKFNEFPKTIIPTIDLDTIKCPEGRVDVEKKIAAWNKIFNLSGSDFAEEYDNLTSIKSAVAERDLENKCYQDYNEDKSYKEAIEKIQETYTHKSYLNFFVIE